VSAWESRSSGLRLVAYGRAYRVRPVGGAWVASEQSARGVTRERSFCGRAGAVAAVEEWAEAARAADAAEAEARRVAAFDAAQLALFGDHTQERAESASLLYAPGGAP